MNLGEYFFITDQSVNNQNKTEPKVDDSGDNSEAILIGLTVTFTIVGIVGAVLGTVFYLKRKNKF